MTYLPGPLGGFLTNRPTVLLIDNGNTNANLLGLYHYTTKPTSKGDQSLVDKSGTITCAVDGSGKPTWISRARSADYLGMPMATARLIPSGDGLDDPITSITWAQATRGN